MSRSERLAAYRHRIHRVKAVASDELIVCSKEYREEEGARCAEELLRSGVPFTAIMAANDLLAFGALKTLQQHGLHCPNDISVTGFNDIPMAERWSPPLTTVKVDPLQAGKAAAEILFADMKIAPEERLPKHVLLPASIIVRGSTAAPSSPRKVRKAHRISACDPARLNRASSMSSSHVRLHYRISIRAPVAYEPGRGQTAACRSLSPERTAIELQRVSIPLFIGAKYFSENYVDAKTRSASGTTSKGNGALIQDNFSA